MPPYTRGESRSQRADGGPIEAEKPSKALRDLEIAASAWEVRTDPRPLTRWLERELDEDGIPRGLPVEDWWPALCGIGGTIPVGSRGRVEGFFRAALRFSEPRFDPVFGGGRPDVRAVRALAARIGDPGLMTVLSWWSPSTGRGNGHAPPLPAFASESSVLGMLRADWSERGDLLGIDHRGKGGPCRIALVGRGRRILGTHWPATGAIGPARLTHWSTGMHGDVIEWSFRIGSTRVIRTAVLLRGRHLALLADQVDGRGEVDSTGVDLADGAEAEPISGSRALRLKMGRQTLGRALPIGLPAAGYPTDRGSIAVDGGVLLLRQRPEASRSWLPLLFSWDADRDRRAVTWRRLTVAERSKACPPGVAFAARVGWGVGHEGLVVYRSLARPALRSFLGHQTKARFFVGAFSETGAVTPLVSIDD